MSVKGRIANYYAKKSKVTEFLWNCAQVGIVIRHTLKGCCGFVCSLQRMCSVYFSHEQCDGSRYEDLRHLCDFLNGVYVYLQDSEVQSCRTCLI